MKIGTRSLLFGVHCFFIHPIVVLCGWRKCYGKFPRRLHEWLAIVFHDWGYWGCSDMDGPEGVQHPGRSVRLLDKWWGVRTPLMLRVGYLVATHSGSYSRFMGHETGALHRPDKLAVLFEPDWFYLLRAKLSGEIYEFIANSPIDDPTPAEWLDWYKVKVITEFYDEKESRQQGCPAL